MLNRYRHHYVIRVLVFMQQSVDLISLHVENEVRLLWTSKLWKLERRDFNFVYLQSTVLTLLRTVNSLPSILRMCTSPDTCRHHLKTHYFQQIFQPT